MSQPPPNPPPDPACDIFQRGLALTPRGPTQLIDGAKMLAIRRLQGVSLDMLIGCTGYSSEEIRAIESGQQAVDQTMLQRISRALNCRPEDLLAG
jgi:DNA-binding Xre family transcriptional regulator